MAFHKLGAGYSGSGMIKTGSNIFTHYFEDGQEVFPCRCGKTHLPGYEFGHHNCFHETDLLLEDNRDGTYQAICPDCGMSWMGVTK